MSTVALIKPVKILQVRMGTERNTTETVFLFYLLLISSVGIKWYQINGDNLKRLAHLDFDRLLLV